MVTMDYLAYEAFRDLPEESQKLLVMAATSFLHFLEFTEDEGADIMDLGPMDVFQAGYIAGYVKRGKEDE
jgi:hypothetical protein